MFTSPNYLIVPSVYTSAAPETAALVSGPAPTSAKLLGLIATNDGYAQACWAQIFDGYGAPSTGAVPIVTLAVAVAGQASLDPGSFNCLPVANGIVVVLSSTAATYTPITNCLFATGFWIT